jgi:hypothetical protein
MRATVQRKSTLLVLLATVVQCFVQMNFEMVPGTPSCVHDDGR